MFRNSEGLGGKDSGGVPEAGRARAGTRIASVAVYGQVGNGRGPGPRPGRVHRLCGAALVCGGAEDLPGGVGARGELPVEPRGVARARGAGVGRRGVGRVLFWPARAGMCYLRSILGAGGWDVGGVGDD